MAAKRQESPTRAASPEHVQEWMERLSKSRDELEGSRGKADEAYASFCTEVRAAFAHGLSAPQISQATGLTGSRLYQVKAGRRT